LTAGLAALLCVLAAAPASGGGVSGALAAAAAASRRGDFGATHEALVDALAVAPAGSEAEASLRLELAEFFAGPAEHPAEAELHLRRLRQIAQPLPHALLQRAAALEGRLAGLRRDWAQERALLAEVQTPALDSVEAAARVASLQALLERAPDFPLAGRAWFSLGREEVRLGDLAAAVEALERAAALRPGLDFHLPLRQTLLEARRRLLERRLRGTAQGTLALGLPLLALLFLRRRPWRRLGWPHLRAALLGAVGLLGLCAGLAWAAQSWLPRPPLDAFAEPVFLASRPGAPGSGLLGWLVLLGLGGLGLSYALGVVFAAARPRWLAALGASLGGLVLWSAGLTLFLLQQVLPLAQLHGAGAGPGGWLAGGAYVSVQDFEPFVLTEPLRYPALPTDTIDEPALVEWIEAHVPRGPAEEPGDAD